MSSGALRPDSLRPDRAPSDSSSEPSRGVRGSKRLVLLAGNPNSGKTTLFNALSGARAKVGNYPGVTVDRRSARVALEGGVTAEIVDLPGTYSLTSRSVEESVAVRAIHGRYGETPEAVVVVLDAAALSRSLYVALQVIETGVPTVIALNMMDEATRAGIVVDADRLSAELGVKVVPIVAAKKHGLVALRAAISRAIDHGTASEPDDDESANEGDSRWAATDPDRDRRLAPIADALPADLRDRPAAARGAYARWALLSVGDDELEDVSNELRAAVERVRVAADAEGRDLSRELIEERYARIDRITDLVVSTRGGPKESRTDRVDRVLLHPVWGTLVFLVVMALVFETLFAWSDPFITAIELGVTWLQEVLTALLPAGAVRGLLVEGVVAGVGNVVVFVPQIALLFVFIGVLEDSGYLARVAFVLDRVMGGVGLHGKAFVPMLSGFACAVPAVLATRTIESRRDRLLTMLVVPLTSCSARLPVYMLVTAAVFAPHERLLGPLSIGAAVLFAMYLLSILFTLGAAAVLRRTVLKGPRPTLVLELPPYRWPVLRNLLRSTWDRVRVFLIEAGTIILAMTVVLWVLLAYPRSEEVTAQHDAMREAVVETGAAREAELERIDGAEAQAHLANSFAGRIGRAMEPALEPIGQDWRIGVGILGAFAAREVFVGTLGVVFGMADADEESEPLRESLRTATWPDGRPLMTPLSGVALLLFFLLAAQCMSTVAVVKRESGGWRWPIFMVVYMTALAYGAALLVYQVGSLLGFE
jgi:ferrous iron transport protein B